MNTAISKPATLSLPVEAQVTLPGSGESWLDSYRSTAADQFAEVGLPTVRDEEWRYTDIRKIKRNKYSLAAAVPDVSNVLAKLPDYGLNRLVLVNGYYAPASSIVNLPAGVSIRSLADVLENNPEQLAELLGSTLPAEQHGFTLLNSAYCLDGLVISIDAKTKLEKPLEIVHVSTAESDSDADWVSHPRNLIITGKLAEAHIIERAIAADDNASYLNNSVTEIIAEDGAQVQHYKIQQEAKNAFHVGGVFIRQGRDANVVNHNISIGGALVRNDIHLQLTGTGAHGGMNGLVVGHDKQHVHNHTEVDHQVPHCTSDEYYKTVLDDQSRSIFRGRIIVAQDAQKTDAEQQNNNLLLSADAEADTKPQLEIYADDVQCSHGATVGQLDQKSLFYFQSRGISKQDARRLLTFAFVNEVIERIKFEPLQAELSQRFLGELLPDTYQDLLKEQFA